MKKLVRFFISVKKEMAKVKWPDKKIMAQYSIATLAFIIFFGVFFTGIDFIVAALSTVIK